MYDVTTGKQEALVIRQSPEALQEWLGQLRSRLGAPVRTAEEVGWNGDAIEGQAFAYLAARSVRGLPLSWPETTGVSGPMTGGTLWLPRP